MRERGGVTGLTTAASLWVCGGIGLAIGAGLYVHGLFAGLIVIMTLSIVNRLSSSFSPDKSSEEENEEEKKDLLEDNSKEKLIIIRDLTKGTIDDINQI